MIVTPARPALVFVAATIAAIAVMELRRRGKPGRIRPPSSELGNKAQLFGEPIQDKPENVGNKRSLLPVPRLMRGRRVAACLKVVLVKARFDWGSWSFHSFHAGSPTHFTLWKCDGEQVSHDVRSREQQINPVTSPKGLSIETNRAGRFA